MTLLDPRYLNYSNESILTAVQNDQGVTTDVREILSAGLQMRATKPTSVAPTVEQEPKFIPKRRPLRLEDLFDDASSKFT